jgi:hypothetical protein
MNEGKTKEEIKELLLEMKYEENVIEEWLVDL